MDNIKKLTIHGEVKEGKSVMKATFMGQIIDVTVDAYGVRTRNKNHGGKPHRYPNRRKGKVRIELAHPSLLSQDTPYLIPPLEDHSLPPSISPDGIKYWLNKPNSPK